MTRQFLVSCQLSMQAKEVLTATGSVLELKGDSTVADQGSVKTVSRPSSSSRNHSGKVAPLSATILSAGPQKPTGTYGTSV